MYNNDTGARSHNNLLLFLNRTEYNMIVVVALVNATYKDLQIVEVVFLLQKSHFIVSSLLINRETPLVVAILNLIA